MKRLLTNAKALVESARRKLKKGAASTLQFAKKNPRLSFIASFIFVGLIALVVTFAADSTPTKSVNIDLCASGTCTNGEVAFKSSSGGTNYVWKPIRLGAGGFATGIDTASDGTKIVRTDSAGAYIWDDSLNGGEWRPLITKSALSGTGLDTPKSGGGVHAVAVAQSNPNVVYMAWKGYVLKSSNKGRNWTKLNIEGTDMNPNADCRAWGGRLAVDPANENVVYFGSIMKGLYAATDGNTFTKVSSVPVAQTESYCDDGGGTIPSAGITGIAFDKSSGVTNGRTNVVYASSHKNGVYRSTNAGASFARTSGGPTSAIHGQAGNGKYYAVGFNGKGSVTTVWRFDGSSWANVTPGGWEGVVTGTEVSTLNIDNKNPNTVVVADHAGDIYISTNGATSWVGETSHKMVAPDMKWLESEQYLVTSQLAFDGQVANRLWLAIGTGVVYADINPASVGAVTWTHKSKGMEQLVQNDVISPPFTAEGQSRLNLAVSDFGNFRINNIDQFTATRWPVQRFTGSWSLDWASQAPNVIVHNTTDILGSQTEAGYSADGGLTWKRFGSMPQAVPGGFGTIAAGDATHFLWQTTSRGDTPARVFYTENAGNSWIDVTPSDVTDTKGLHFAYYTKKKNIAYDRVTAGVAYLYYNDQYTERVYKSTNYGRNWTKAYEVVSPTSYDNRDKTLTGAEGFFNPTMKPVPTKAGNLFITGGPSGGDKTIGNKDASGSKMMFSQNGGTSWARVAGGNGVYGFGFGAPKTTGAYPTVYAVGYVQPAGGQEEYGIWRGEDFNPATGSINWKKIGDYPNGNLSQPFSVDGDKQVFGKVYLSTGSDGAFYGQPQ